MLVLTGATICCILLPLAYGMFNYNAEKNVSDVAIAITEIINGLKPSQLVILAKPTVTGIVAQTNNNGTSLLNEDVDDIIYLLHKLFYKSVIFYDVDLYFKHIEENIQGSIETFSLIFCIPYELSEKIKERNLSHRLSLFIFYWGARMPPRATEIRFEEPVRAVVITRPREKAYRIYYNQAKPDGVSDLKLINWYDAENLGLHKTPLLPSSASVYANFKGRVFRVPVFHSPPWFWVNYENVTGNTTSIADYEDIDYHSEENRIKVNVTGGRDHRLLALLARHMNFHFVYIDSSGKTQGPLKTDDQNSTTFTGGIGLLQNGMADFLLGDVSLSWERRKAVEFSFFTLADSGAFATHAPRRLNEAFAIIRPFKMDVWPYLIMTILLSGPLFYFIIAVPYKWNFHSVEAEANNDFVIHAEYINEITLVRTTQIKRKAVQNHDVRKIPKRLFDRCIWFTVQLFLKQSCQEPYNGYRAKFLMIVYWIAATYVLADVYSAQLTSQFARPAHEPPINNLQKLQRVMIDDGYRLYVEKESSYLEMLVNGTEIFRHLYALMKHQADDEEGFLIDSVEAGIKLITDGLENKAVLGGRETLYFNIQQFGSKSFQLSHKLYTRYSAVAVRIGCPFLDSLNDVLIRLFESGILDKMTSAEYEALSRLISKDSKLGQDDDKVDQQHDSNSDDEIKKKSNGKGVHMPSSMQGTGVIQPINLRMLQGAFIVLVCGYGMAGLVLVLEFLCFEINPSILLEFRQRVVNVLKKVRVYFLGTFRLCVLSLLRLILARRV